MRSVLLLIPLLLSSVPALAAECPKLLNHQYATLQGGQVNLCDYADRAILVVNTASYCGYTPQYEGLERLYKRFQKQGLVVLGFPSNDFGAQEPGSNHEVAEFCRLNYGVSFPLSKKLEVNGHDRHQLYRLLAGEGAEFPGDITWNFEKFLLGKDGRVLARFSPRTAPDDPSVITAIEKALS